MLSRLNRFLEQQEILHETQHGFKSKHSITTAALKTI